MIKIDFSVAASEQIESFFYGQIKRIRLARNLTQSQLASQAGVSEGTVKRLENGHGASFNTVIRILMALGLQQNLETLLPDPVIRPIERVNTGGRERKRARPAQPEGKDSLWIWGDQAGDKK